MAIAVAALASAQPCPADKGQSATPDSVSSAHVEPKRSMLFRGAPLSECRGFWVTEFGWVRRFGSAPEGIEEGWSGSWALGGMLNMSRRSALGLTGFARVDMDRELYFVGPAARYRFWLWPAQRPREWISLELSAGPIFTIGDGRYLESSPHAPRGANVDSPGFMVDAMVNVTDVFSVTLRREWVPLVPDGPAEPVPDDNAWYAGVRLDSYPGAILGTLMGLIYGVGAGETFFSGD